MSNDINEIVKRLSEYDRTKHIEVDRYFIKDKLENGIVCIS